MKSKTRQKFKRIAQKGSKTYFNSTLFFPKKIREEVFTLYSFVRVADNFVDKIPQDKNGFLKFQKDFNTAYISNASQNVVLQEFVLLMKRRKFKKEWVDAFLSAMRSDLNHKKCKTLSDTLLYMYGSAEVVGLMMAQLLNLSPKSHPYAKYLGRSMQYINFLRDIEEDNGLKRQYIPQEFLKKNGLLSLNKKVVAQNQENFIKLMHTEIKRYLKWQKEAEKGYKYIPYRYLIPIKTASDMYNWTAHQMYNDPLRVYEQKIKPSKLRIYFTIFKNSILILLWKI